MKIGIASDIHLEFGRIDIDNPGGVDTLVLAGDICVAERITPAEDWFFQNVSQQFKNVIYIMGNHEHYHGDFLKTRETLKNTLDKYGNIQFLENEVVLVDDVLFYGATFWTDMNNGNPNTMLTISQNMNDFHIIDNFSTEKAVEENQKSRDRLKLWIDSSNAAGEESKKVVVSHHSPSFMSVHPKYANHTDMNYGYANNLDQFILDNPEIKLWIHGHTHHPFDYMLGDTRIVCNPRGYINYEPMAKHWKLKVVEI